MARYIDADALIKKIYPMGIGDGKYTINAKAVKLAIDNTPTADVVPKSEYDAVVSALDNSTKEFLKLHDDYQEAKSEVESLEGELIVETTRRKNAATAYNDAKSEVDKWKGRCTDWCEVAYLKSQRILELEAELSKAKGEVEQIFEEIEEKIEREVRFYKSVYDASDDTENLVKAKAYGRVIASGIIHDFIIELKKKHTEGKT